MAAATAKQADDALGQRRDHRDRAERRRSRRPSADAIADGSQHAGEDDPEQHARQTLDEQVLDDGPGRVRAVSWPPPGPRSR